MLQIPFLSPLSFLAPVRIHLKSFWLYPDYLCKEHQPSR